MLVKNLETEQSFHLPNETARAMIATGKFVEVKAERKPLLPTGWYIQPQTENQLPILHAKCPNCGAEPWFKSVNGTAHATQKFHHPCFGKPETCPADVAAQYIESYREWKISQGRR